MNRKTQAELSRELRCSRKTVSKHLAQADAPRPDREGRYDVNAVKDYILIRRGLDKKAPDSAALLAARIENLSLENQLLKQRLKIDRPSFTVDEVSRLLWEFLAEARRHHIAAMNASAYLCVNQPDPRPVLKILWDALNEAEANIGAWCQDHDLRVNELREPWPIPHPSYAPLMKEKPTERKENRLMIGTSGLSRAFSKRF